jgi:hypothetical protein
MPSSTDYQLYAQQCLRWADEAENEEHRQAFLEMAKVWTQLTLKAWLDCATLRTRPPLQQRDDASQDPPSRANLVRPR